MKAYKWISRTFFLVLALVAATGPADAEEPAWNTDVFPIAYKINDTGAPEGFADVVRDCVEQWHQVVSSSMSFKYNGLTTRNVVSGDGFNLIGWNSAGEGMGDIVVETVARTNDDGYIIECDTMFNGACGWSTTGSPEADEYDLRTAVLREIGRWVQLPYGSDPASVMYDPLELGVVRDALSQADKDAISAVYPAAHEPDIFEPGDDVCAGATELVMNEAQTGEAGQGKPGHNIYPYDDEDWFRFTLDVPKSVRIATSGPDPLGDTELFLYDSCPPGDPLGHADDVATPTLSLPSPASRMNYDGSYTFTTDISDGPNGFCCGHGGFVAIHGGKHRYHILGGGGRGRRRGGFRRCSRRCGTGRRR